MLQRLVIFAKLELEEVGGYSLKYHFAWSALVRGRVGLFNKVFIAKLQIP